MSVYSDMLKQLAEQRSSSGGSVPSAGVGDMTQQNLALLAASQARPTNLGLPAAVPMDGGQTDYRAMLAQLQQGQAQGQMPGFPGMQGMRYAPGAGMLPNVPQAPMPQAAPPPTWTPQPVGSPPTGNLGLGGGVPNGNPYDQQFNYARIALR